MKKYIYISLFTSMLTGCKQGQTDTKEYFNGGEVIKNYGVTSTIIILDEFEYKGHIYINCDVKGGISMTHAGHCKCNK